MKSLILILALIAAPANADSEHGRESDGAREDAAAKIRDHQWQGTLLTKSAPLTQKEMAYLTKTARWRKGESFGNWIIRLQRQNQNSRVGHKISPPILKMSNLRLAVDKRFASLNSTQQQIYYWLVSLYADLKYGSSMPQMLEDLVSLQTLQTVRDVEWSQPPVANPDLTDPTFKQNHPFQYAQLKISQFALDAGLTSYNASEPGKFVCPQGASSPFRSDCSHKIFVVELAGKPANAIHPLGLYVHVDVVPTGSAWSLLGDTGESVMPLDPFKMTLLKASDLKLDATRTEYHTQYVAAMKQYKESGNKDSDALRWGQYLERRVNDLTGSRYYGRGTIDDKAQVVSGLYALKTIHELQAGGPHTAYMPVLNKPVQMIIETSEETTTEGVDVYLPWAASKGINSTSEVNLGLDANYPACIAENGIYREQFQFAPQSSDVAAGDLTGNQVMIDNFHGAEDPANQARNNIPGLFKITFVGPGITALKTLLDDKTFMAAFETYLQNKWKVEDPVKAQLITEGETVAHLWHPLNPSTEISGNQLIVRLNGYERVSFKPMDADSALVRGAGLFEYINAQAASGTTFAFTIMPNAYTRLAHFVWDIFGFEYYAAKLGLAFYDRFNLAGGVIDPSTEPDQSFMGPLTAVPTQIDVPSSPSNHVNLYVDMRVPRGNVNKAADDTELHATFAAFGAKAHAVYVNLEAKYAFSLAAAPVTNRPPRYVDPTQDWMNSLIGLFQTYTGRNEWGYVSIRGSTTASASLNGINFGPTLPFENDVYHVPNEFKKVDDFHNDLKMFTNAFLDLGQR